MSGPHEFSGGSAERFRLPDNIAFDLGALLEPLSVATHAARRAQMSRGCSVLVFGAGAVGLLCALMARISGASKVATADVQHGRTRFALEHRFASRGYTPERKAASGAEDRMQGAKDTSLLVSSARRAGDDAGGYDVVFECTGVEACTQAAIYVGRPLPRFDSLTYSSGCTSRRESRDRRYGQSDPDNSSFCSRIARSRHHWNIQVRQHIY